MGNIIEYNGYQASIEYSSEDGILFGRVLHINSLITFEASDASAIEAAFRGAIDEYLEYCKRANVEPNKAYSGTLNVRIGSERHRNIAFSASKEGCSVNEAICKAIDLFFENRSKSTIQNGSFLTGNQWEKVPQDDWKWSLAMQSDDDGGDNERRH
ncbi:type II toxin-antitoxin system HicB family antitoxin [Acidithiobacillus sp.]|uniref:type II toxin-antitoxin system HicB family antitoxin n=1 Tax=Acidithiobacillus sp. TaxID=1872118 RepID=UPI00258ABC55|nr:type II toxin-antitoxin system HicB family antitoxin [Acidithiobacillus sp.]MDD5376444.1 type II toxin-antitoxin system HicB family antitoxin [Acidithiobacillus sp.]